MFFQYALEFLKAEDGLTDPKKREIAGRIEGWGLEHDIRDEGRLHEILDLWIDDATNKDRRALELNRQIGEGCELVNLIADPKSVQPVDSVEFDSMGIDGPKLLSPKELTKFSTENLPETEAKVVVGVAEKA